MDDGRLNTCVCNFEGGGGSNYDNRNSTRRGAPHITKINHNCLIFTMSGLSFQSWEKVQ